MEQFVYIIGLIFVLVIIFISIDDLLWDIYYAIGKLTGKIKVSSINVQEIESVPPKMLAIIVAAYNEEKVLKLVIQNLIKSNQYPESMYHIFLGVYPNDEGTMRVADELEAEFSNVHKIIHVLNGPSSKADNLNNVIKNVYQFEADNHLEFEAVVIHDSEDLIHPYEFKLENYLLSAHAAIQIPVFPLQQMPSLSNVFTNMVSGSYADEFAENHYRILLSRRATEAFVPSAGTGFVIRRDILAEFENAEVFPVGSLTEDYKLSLEFKKMGYDVHYVLEDVKRLRNDGSVAREFISTRSMFPSSYKAAVRQKTRWIYGITIQTFKLKEILKNNTLNFTSKYSLYRDWKAKFGNLLLGPGYLIFIYFLISLFIDIPIMYPANSFAWYLMLLLSVIMVERQVLRFLAVKNVYGHKSAMISTLFPPILPIRMVIGNIINFHATVNAWKQNRQQGRKKTAKKPKWTKTDHEFLEENVLQTFRRNLGDTLLYKGLITSEVLDDALRQSRQEGCKLGNVLLKTGLVTEKDIARAVCEINHQTFTDFNYLNFSNPYISGYDKGELFKLKAVPILYTGSNYVILTTIDADIPPIQSLFGKDAKVIYTTAKNIEYLLTNEQVSDSADSTLVTLENYLKQDFICAEQGIIALTYKTAGDSIDDILSSMGLLKELPEPAHS